jgi:tRNA 2-thiocytidine biosynthesis protein TtcA
MIEDGDKVMVCLSGGKDSYALLDILMTLRERAPINFDIVAVNLDQKQPNFPAEVLPAYLDKARRPVPHREPGHLQHRQAPDPGRQDHLLALFQAAARHPVPRGGRTRLQQDRPRPPPRRHPRDLLPEHVLRREDQGHAGQAGLGRRQAHGDPPAGLREGSGHRALCRSQRFPIIPCDLCGSQENLQRKQIKAMLRDWEKKHPGRVENIFSSLSTVVPSHLMDRDMFGFVDLKTDGVAQSAATATSPSTRSRARRRGEDEDAALAVHPVHFSLLRGLRTSSCAPPLPAPAWAPSSPFCLRGCHDHDWPGRLV